MRGCCFFCLFCFACWRFCFFLACAFAMLCQALVNQWFCNWPRIKRRASNPLFAWLACAFVFCLFVFCHALPGPREAIVLQAGVCQKGEHLTTMYIWELSLLHICVKPILFAGLCVVRTCGFAFAGCLILVGGIGIAWGGSARLLVFFFCLAGVRFCFLLVCVFAMPCQSLVKQSFCTQACVKKASI